MGIFYKYKQGGKLFDPEGDGEKSAGYEIYTGKAEQLTLNVELI